MGTRTNIRATATLAAVFWAAGALAAPRDAETTAEMDRMVERVETAYQLRDLGALEEIRAGLARHGAATDDGGLRDYLGAYARFRQALGADGDASARSYLDDCIAELESLVARHPDHAQARALLGSCYGLSTRYHRAGMATRGLAARRQMAAARRLAADDPWIVMQDGIADFSTPRLFGGDRQLGVRKLERATALFAAAVDAGSRRAAWGAAEAWSQLGQMYDKVGRSAEARQALARSAALMPRPAGLQLAVAN